MDISRLLINQKAFIRDALDILNNNEEKIVLVVDENKKLIGTVTDGDIRRGILKGLTLESKLKDVMNKSYFSVDNDISEINAFDIMKQNDLKQLPILSQKGIPERLILIDKKLDNSKKNNTVFILAGGEGKRLYPLTKKCPKPMLKIGNKPMLENVINQFKFHGYNNFFISVNYLKNVIIDYFKDGRNLDVNIQYIEEKSKLGTAGSLSLLPQKFSDPIIVTNADVITTVNYVRLLEHHTYNKNFVTICTRKHFSSIPFGVIEIDGDKVIEFIEKPSLSHNINAGIYVINPNAIKYLEKNVRIDIPEFLTKLIKIGKKVSVFPVHEDWQDIGLLKTYEEYRNKNL